MPTIRKYHNAAEKQAAYRQRTLAAAASARAAHNLPPLSPVPTIPSYRRWNAMTANALELLSRVQDEMRTYADERSEAWQQTDNAEKLEEQMQALEQAIDALQE